MFISLFGLLDLDLIALSPLLPWLHSRCCWFRRRHRPVLENMGFQIKKRSCLVCWQWHLLNVSTVFTVGTSSALQLLTTVLMFDFLLSSLHRNSIFFLLTVNWNKLRGNWIVFPWWCIITVLSLDGLVPWCFICEHWAVWSQVSSIVHCCLQFVKSSVEFV